MKKLFALILIFCLLPKVAFATTYVTIAVDGVNIRQAPSTVSTVLQKTNRGTRFEWMKTVGDWYQLKLADGTTAYVATQLATLATSQNNKITKLAQQGKTTDRARLREEPSTSAKILATLNPNVSVQIIEEQGEWYKITVNGQTGYMAKTLIVLGQTKMTKTALQSVVVVEDVVNLRTEASLKSKVVMKLMKNDEVTVVRQMGDWYEVMTADGTKGFIFSNYVRETTKVLTTSTVTGQTATVIASTLSVRETSNPNSLVIAYLKKDTTVKMIEQTGSYTHIESDTISGWVASWYLQVNEKKSPQTKITGTVRVLYDGTNVRQKPTTAAKVVARYNANDELEIVGQSGTWLKVKISPFTEGYIAGWLVAKVSEVKPTVERPTTTKSLATKVIVVDPGHGGRDGGAQGPRGTLEKQMTLQTAQQVYERLRQLGAKVVLTRSSDYYISLRARVSTSHRYKADAFISIHFDSGINNSARGLTAFYYHAAQKPLATLLEQKLRTATKQKSRGVQKGDYFVLRENRQPSVLLELGYINNPLDELLIRSAVYQAKVGEAITTGVVEYLTK